MKISIETKLWAFCVIVISIVVILIIIVLNVKGGMWIDFIIIYCVCCGFFIGKEYCKATKQKLINGVTYVFFAADSKNKTLFLEFHIDEEICMMPIENQHLYFPIIPMLTEKFETDEGGVYEGVCFGNIHQGDLVEMYEEGEVVGIRKIA